MRLKRDHNKMSPESHSKVTRKSLDSLSRVARRSLESRSKAPRRSLEGPSKVTRESPEGHPKVIRKSLGRLSEVNRNSIEVDRDSVEIQSKISGRSVRQMNIIEHRQVQLKAIETVDRQRERSRIKWIAPCRSCRLAKRSQRSVAQI
jgi:hypothetical protein